MEFLTLDGLAVRVTRFRRAADEVSAGGMRAAVWEADALVFSDAEAAALRALGSYNLRRALGWQLRGNGYGDVAMAGSGATATVRIEVGDEDYDAPTSAAVAVDPWRTVSLRLREQVPT